jgi:hypothetical protein
MHFHCCPVESIFQITYFNRRIGELQKIFILVKVFLCFAQLPTSTSSRSSISGLSTKRLTSTQIFNIAWNSVLETRNKLFLEQDKDVGQ